MFDPARHRPASSAPWDEAEAREEIQKIASDAAANYSPDRLWAAHPLDEGLGDGTTSLYLGAAGVIWALDYLKREGAATHDLDFSASLPCLLEQNRAEYKASAGLFGMEDQRASWLFGDLPILLMMIRARTSAGAADELHQRIGENLSLPSLELMWGDAGAMLACVFAHELTAEHRWRGMFDRLATRLLAGLEETDQGPIWTQVMYGGVRRFLGPVHGFAGNIQALVRGWDWLAEDDRARIRRVVAATAPATAVRGDGEANWRPLADQLEQALLVQYCHGAPGMVFALADPRLMNAKLTALMEAGGRLAWTAGPLAKGSNLCHGTGGNGYAFLKLHDLTGEPVWLDRARTFAMAAIDQRRAASAEYGRGRYSLWTGDVGLACYLHDVLRSRPRFPTVDVF